MSEPAAVRPMRPDEYEAWRRAELESYAAEMVESGMLGEAAARARAAAQHAEYLPDEQATTGMHLLRVLDADGVAVGSLWLGPHPRKPGAGYVYDVVIDEAHRGRGLGRGAMLAAEEAARAAGWDELGLNVFGPNARARSLYDSLGYTVVTTSMTKRLDGPAQPGRTT